MTMFKTFENGIQVNGQTINSVVDALSSIKFVVDRYFEESGLPKAREINSEAWYDQQSWLNVFKMISEKIGDRSMKKIGNLIPENAKFPPEVDSIEKGLGSIDVAYHMNHRNASGQVLFDNGQMYEGIGHYRFELTNENQGKLKCENPYHCDFDLGIIETMAKKFNPTAKVSHNGEGCRKEGKKYCSYLVEWQ